MDFILPLIPPAPASYPGRVRLHINKKPRPLPAGLLYGVAKLEIKPSGQRGRKTASVRDDFSFFFHFSRKIVFQI